MNALLDILETAGHVLDTPGALLRTALAGRNPLPGIFDPAQRVSGRDLLEQWGALDANQEGLDWGDAAGVGMELALDPLNLLGGWGLARTLGKRAAARASNAKRAQLLEAGAMPEEIAQLTKAVDETGRPVTTYHGTPHVYDRPDLAKADPNALYGPGYYTTEDLNLASTYGSKGAQGEALPGWAAALEEPLARAQAQQQALREAYEASLKPGINNAALSQNRESLYNTLINFNEPSSIRSYQTLEGKRAKLRTFEDALAQFPELEPFYRAPPMNVRMQYLDVRNPFDMDAPLPADLLDRLRRVSPRAEQRLLNTIPAQASPPTGDMVFRALAGEDLSPTDLLRQAGYDAITHTGGQRVGDTAHKVWISLDPDRQVYGPWVAPAQIREPRVNPLLAGLTGHNLLARNHRGY